MSNHNEFFIVSCDDKSIKIFRNFGNISEAKIFTQINLDFNANCTCLYVDDFHNGKLEGFIGVGRDNDILIYNTKGELYLELPEAHNGEILGLYITKEDDNKDNKNLILISAGKDGRIKIWKI